jgi:hypothetical protein
MVRSCVPFAPIPRARAAQYANGKQLRLTSRDAHQPPSCSPAMAAACRYRRPMTSLSLAHGVLLCCQN